MTLSKERRREKGTGPVTSFCILVCALLSALPVRAQQDPLAPIATRMRASDHGGVLSAIAALPADERTRPLVIYARGRALYGQGNLADAAAAFAEIEGADLPAELLTDAAMRRGTSLARTGRCNDARPILATLAARGGSIGAIARARAAECALAQNDLVTAEAELGAVVRENAGAVDLFAARLELAEAKARRTDREGAIRELRALVIERPEHPEATLARARLLELDPAAAFTPEEHMNIAERLLDEKLPSDALTELEAIHSPPSEALDRFLHLQGNAIFATRREYARAAEVLARSAARSRSRWAIDDEMQAARARSRAGDRRAAIRAYRAFARAHPTHADAPEASYLAAWLELREKLASSRGKRVSAARARQAERAMTEFVREHDVRGASRAARGFVRDAQFELALYAFETGRFDDAATRFEAYASEEEDSAMIGARGLYWAGRSHQLAGHRREAIARYRAALVVEPLHWYACLAAQRLRDLGEEPGDPFPPTQVARPDPTALPAVELPVASRAYASIGLDRDAIGVVRASEQTIREAAPEGRGLEALVATYTALGATSRAYRLVAQSNELGKRVDGVNRFVYDAAYPHPYRHDIEAAATAQSIPPELLYAIMRQESAYDPEAVSYADAIGLIQLIPPTAERVARSAGIELHREMLFDPQVNVQLGSRYLGTLLRGLGGAYPLAIAGYNAGGHRVQEWLAESGEMELDLFVERIPYDQTRNYVRRVTTHLARYLYLEDPERGFPLELPPRVTPR